MKKLIAIAIAVCVSMPLSTGVIAKTVLQKDDTDISHDFKDFVALNEGRDDRDEVTSDYVGGFVFDCDITYDFMIEDCKLITYPEGEPEETSLQLVEMFQKQWADKPYTDAPNPGERQKFTLCDDSGVMQKMLEAGMGCASDIKFFTHLYKTGPSKEKMDREIERQMSRHELPDGTAIFTEISYPGHEDMADMYPYFAMRDNRNGTVVLECHWNDEGVFDECRILAEYPKGYGFGVATAFLFRDKAKAAPTPDISSEKRWRRFTYKWIME